MYHMYLAASGCSTNSDYETAEAKDKKAIYSDIKIRTPLNREVDLNIQAIHFSGTTKQTVGENGLQINSPNEFAFGTQVNYDFDIQHVSA